MKTGSCLFRFGLLVLAGLLIVPVVSAWTFSGWTGPSATDVLRPGDPVKAVYSLGFSSYDSGTTFESDDSLVMYTELADPKWVVTMTETINDQPSTTTLVSKQAIQVRLDGWSLSFSRKQFSLTVTLTGTVPPMNQSADITVLRLQELDPSAKLVSGTQTKKIGHIEVPTPEPTPEPTVIPEDTVLVITPEPTTLPVTAAATAAPSRKPTYSPGPDPLLLCALLAGLVLALGTVRRMK